jgi:hypothetical protein
VSELAQENKQTLFQSLERQYDQEMTRRATLNGQATSLLTFAGIIQTILVTLLLDLTTSSQAKPVLLANPNVNLVVCLLGIGFVAYIATILLGILAFWETKWTPAPQVLDGSNLETDPIEWRKTLDEYEKNPEKIPIVIYEMQLRTATVKHRLTNGRKYQRLLVAFSSLIVGIVLTALAGFLLLLGSI